MISAIHLRVGNWVSVPMCAAHWQITEVMKSSVKIDDFNNDIEAEMNDIGFEELFPIKLNREVLQRTEFFFHPGREGLMDLYEIQLWDGRRMELLHLGLNNYTLTIIKGSIRGLSVNIDSLHNLQNEYFNMTGSELAVDAFAKRLSSTE